MLVVEGRRARDNAQVNVRSKHVAVILARDLKPEALAHMLQQLGALAANSNELELITRVARVGRWEATTHEPAPMTPTRRRLMGERLARGRSRLHRGRGAILLLGTFLELIP